MDNLYNYMMQLIPYELRKSELITRYIKIVAENLGKYTESNLQDSEFSFIDKMKNGKLDVYGSRYGVVRKDNQNDNKMRYEIKRSKYKYNNNFGIVENLLRLINTVGYASKVDYYKNTTGESLAMKVRVSIPVDGDYDLVNSSADSNFVFASRVELEVVQGAYKIIQKTGKFPTNRRIKSTYEYVEVQEYE